MDVTILQSSKQQGVLWVAIPCSRARTPFCLSSEEPWPYQAYHCKPHKVAEIQHGSRKYGLSGPKTYLSSNRNPTAYLAQTIATIPFGFDQAKIEHKQRIVIFVSPKLSKILYERSQQKDQSNLFSIHPSTSFSKPYYIGPVFFSNPV
jgi:hypothetical protein